MAGVLSAFFTVGAVTSKVRESPFVTAATSVPLLLTLIVGLVSQVSVALGVAGVPPLEPPLPGVALAGTTTRLRTNVRANSKERNFFI